MASASSPFQPVTIYTGSTPGSPKEGVVGVQNPLQRQMSSLTVNTQKAIGDTFDPQPLGSGLPGKKLQVVTLSIIISDLEIIQQQKVTQKGEQIIQGIPKWKTAAKAALVFLAFAVVTATALAVTILLSPYVAPIAVISILFLLIGAIVSKHYYSKKMTHLTAEANKEIKQITSDHLEHGTLEKNLTEDLDSMISENPALKNLPPETKKNIVALAEVSLNKKILKNKIKTTKDQIERFSRFIQRSDKEIREMPDHITRSLLRDDLAPYNTQKAELEENVRQLEKENMNLEKEENRLEKVILSTPLYESSISTPPVTYPTKFPVEHQKQFSDSTKVLEDILQHLEKEFEEKEYLSLGKPPKVGKLQFVSEKLIYGQAHILKLQEIQSKLPQAEQQQIQKQIDRFEQVSSKMIRPVRQDKIKQISQAGESARAWRAIIDELDESHGEGQFMIPLASLLRTLQMQVLKDLHTGKDLSSLKLAINNLRGLIENSRLQHKLSLMNIFNKDFLGSGDQYTEFYEALSAHEGMALDETYDNAIFDQLIQSRNVPELQKMVMGEINQAKAFRDAGMKTEASDALFRARVHLNKIEKLTPAQDPSFKTVYKSFNNLYKKLGGVFPVTEEIPPELHEIINLQRQIQNKLNALNGQMVPSDSVILRSLNKDMFNLQAKIYGRSGDSEGIVDSSRRIITRAFRELQKKFSKIQVELKVATHETSKPKQAMQISSLQNAVNILKIRDQIQETTTQLELVTLEIARLEKEKDKLIELTPLTEITTQILNIKSFQRQRERLVHAIARLKNELGFDAENVFDKAVNITVLLYKQPHGLSEGEQKQVTEYFNKPLNDINKEDLELLKQIVVKADKKLWKEKFEAAEQELEPSQTSVDISLEAFMGIRDKPILPITKPQIEVMEPQDLIEALAQRLGPAPQIASAQPMPDSKPKGPILDVDDKTLRDMPWLFEAPVVNPQPEVAQEPSPKPAPTISKTPIESIPTISKTSYDPVKELRKILDEARPIAVLLDKPKLSEAEDLQVAEYFKKMKIVINSENPLFIEKDRLYRKIRALESQLKRAQSPSL
jgi:hypothetical protein